MKNLKTNFILFFLIFFVFHFFFCSEDKKKYTNCGYEKLDISVCSADKAGFSTDITHPYLPLKVGSKWVLEGKEDGVLVKVEIEVLDQIETVAGVDTRVVTETEYEDGELIEISTNFFVQTADGTVCYFGEDVDDYKNGVVVSHKGKWRSGINGAKAGIFMPANPKSKTEFYQEYAPGVAMDKSAIVESGKAVSVPFGNYTDTLILNDWNPLDDDTCHDAETKVYAKDVGFVSDSVMKLTDFTK